MNAAAAADFRELAENLPDCARDMGDMTSVKADRHDVKTGGPATAGPAADVPRLPAWKAFVLQFSRESGTRAGIFAGRVEHLSSGRRVHFDTREELLRILDEQLEKLGQGSDLNDPSTE